MDAKNVFENLKTPHSYLVCNSKIANEFFVAVHCIMLSKFVDTFVCNLTHLLLPKTISMHLNELSCTWPTVATPFIVIDAFKAAPRVKLHSFLGLVNIIPHILFQYIR